jgi:tripartite-type tricarboxylate transporter receptor subunit TctC
VATQLAKDAADILNQASVREQLMAQGLSDATQKPAEFAAHIATDTATWARITKARRITAE